jgi:hypothetical protein
MKCLGLSLSLIACLEPLEILGCHGFGLDPTSIPITKRLGNFSYRAHANYSLHRGYGILSFHDILTLPTTSSKMMDGKPRISSLQRMLFRISRRPKGAIVGELRVITCRKSWLDHPAYL